MAQRTARRAAGTARTRGARLVAAATAAGLLALAACSSSPSSSPGEIPSGAAPAPGAPAQSGSVAFTPCDGGFQCADVTVPIDYANERGPTMTIAIVRKPAEDQGDKLGVLLVNPGGPGGSGIETVESGAVPSEVADRFDVIGFDPRGVGRSEGLSCPLGPDTPYLGDPDPGDVAAEAATSAAVDRYVGSCNARYQQLLPHLGTRNVARDMDRVREALGEERISYLGYSYGTSIGQTYLQMFGPRVRTMVLDGVVDVSKPGLDSSQSESFENSLRAFAADCASRSTCAAGPDAIALVDRLRARLAAAPQPVPGAATPLTAGLFEIGLALPLYSRSNWPELASALGALNGGDGRPMRGLAGTYFQGSNSDTYNAVTCLDSAWPRDRDEVLVTSRIAETRAPHFTGNFLVSGLTCAGWPAPSEPLVAPGGGTGAPPVLVVGTTRDPATPYGNSVDLARHLPGSALLTYDGDGHTAYGKGDSCVDDAVNDYLTDATLPSPDTRC